MNANDVIDNIVQIRKNKRLTVAELARRADISKGYLHQLESGGGNPSLSVLLKIAQGLNVSPDAFFWLPGFQTDEATLLHAWQSGNMPHILELVAEYLDTMQEGES